MYKILTDDTKNIIYHSAVHSALVPGEHNLFLPLLDDDDLNVPQVIHSHVHAKGELSQGEPTRMPTISPDDLLGRSVLLPPNDVGEHFCATIVCKIIDHDKDFVRSS